MRRPFAFLAALAALLGPAQAAPGGILDQDAVARPELGFRVERPDAGWCFKDDAGSLPEGLHARLTLAPKAAGTPAVYVSIEVRDASALKAEELVSMSARSLEASGKAVTQGKAVIGGVEAPWIRGDAPGPNGRPYRYQLAFLIRDGLRFQITCAALKGAFDQRMPTFKGILAAVTWTPRARSAAEKTKARLAVLGRRCGSELPWASDWESAARRARDEGRPILAVYTYYAGFAIPDRSRSGPFMDPDLVALIKARFVPIAMNSATASPLRRPEVYGLSSSSFGTAYIVASPEGQVLRETGGFDAAHLYDVLRRCLPKAPRPSGPPLLAAAEALRRGQLAEAEALLAGRRSAGAERLRAALHRRRRQGPQALAALERAASLAKGEALRAELAADRAVILMRSGALVESEAAFAAIAGASGPRQAEALYWLGALQVLRGAKTATYASWSALLGAHPESRWAWKAAAEMSGQGCFTLGSERLRWPSEEAIEAYRVPEPEALDEKRLDQVEAGAIAYLLSTQGGEGGWLYPPEALTPAGGVYTDAISAIVGLALLRHRERAGVADALRRVLDRLRDLHKKGRLAYRFGAPVGAHAIWRRAFLIWFLAESRQAEMLGAEEARAMLAPLLAAIAREQAASGGWPYISLPSSLRAPSADSSASFLAAGIIQALLAARESGAALPEGMLERALLFLDGLRREDGRFRYMPAITAERPLPEAAGRGPVCALALQLGGRAELGLIRKTLELFVKHARSQTAELRKELGHTGPEGQGSHYFFYDYRFAAAAVRRLPAEERARYRGPLIEDILKARGADGSFVAMPKLGRPYGTAMALLALDDLRAR